MPDHAHLLLSPLRDADGWNFSLPQIMHAIKGVSARKINVLLDRCGPVWQEEFFDHVLRSNDSVAEKMDYICRNPVRAGLVKVESEYPWLWRGDVPICSFKHCGLSGRLTGSETRSHTASGPTQTYVTARSVPSVM